MLAERDDFPFGFMLPKLLAGFGVNGIKHPLACSDKNCAVGQQRRRQHRDRWL